MAQRNFKMQEHVVENPEIGVEPRFSGIDFSSSEPIHADPRQWSCTKHCHAEARGGIGVIDAGDSPVTVDHVTSRLITFSLWQYCGSAFEWNGPGNLSSIGHK